MAGRVTAFARAVWHSHVPARLAISAVVLVPFLVHAAGWFNIGFFGELENFAYDARVRATMPGGIDERIVIVDLDERSLAAEGHWPWPRDRLATLVDRLFDDYGVRSLGFDVVYSEPDEPSALTVIDELVRDPAVPAPLRASLADRRRGLENDRIFAESLIARDVVLGYALRFDTGSDAAATTGALPAPVRQQAELGEIDVAFPRARGYVAPLPVLQADAAAAGFINKPLIDSDGVTRRAATLAVYDGDLYASLGLALARNALGNPPVQFAFARRDGQLSGLEIEGLQLGDSLFAVDHRAAMLVPYRGPRGSYRYVSATDVLDGAADPAVLEGRIAVFGASAAGLLDLHATPAGNAFPGVEIHANVIAGMLDGNVRHRPDWARGVELLSLLIIALLVALVLPRLPPFAEFLMLVGMAAVILIVNLYFWTAADFVIPLAGTLAFLFVAALLQLNYGYFVEAANKRRLSRLFGQYIPPEIVDEMDAQNAEISVEGESREMTVLFSDVRGFTTISEGMQPTELTRFMNAFLTPITEIIHRNRGTIDKYMGDAVMAFWGAPLRDPQHARHAVQAGLEMIARMNGLRAEFAGRGWPEVRIGVGVNTGPMNVGNMGSKFRVAYTVLGDAVNLGSRLEGQTKSYGVEFIVSESTYAALPDFAFRELDKVRVKGKNEPVGIYEPLGPADDLSSALRAELAQYHAALQRYRAQDWDRAEREFAALQERRPHPVYAIYRERIVAFRQSPPGTDWDGVFNLTSK